MSIPSSVNVYSVEFAVYSATGQTGTALTWTTCAMDVSDALQQYLNAGITTLCLGNVLPCPNTNLPTGTPYPAFIDIWVGQPKSFAASVLINGTSTFFAGLQGTTINFANPATSSSNSFEVLSAVYGATSTVTNQAGTTQAQDVSGTLQQYLNAGFTTLCIGNGLPCPNTSLPKGTPYPPFLDPFPGTVKAFAASVIVNGVTLNFGCSEGGTINFAVTPNLLGSFVQD